MADPVGICANVCAACIVGIFQKIKLHVRYVIVYKKNVMSFKEKMELLTAKRESVRQEVDAAIRNLETILADVQLWCERADKTVDDETKEVNDLEDKAKAECFLGLCPNIKSRYQLSRKAEEYVTVVDQLLQQCQFDKVGFRDVLEAPIRAVPKNLTDFDSRKVVFDEIMEALKDSKICMIGVYGPGGVGKTTLVNEVARRVKETGLFCPVVVVTVTLTPNIKNIQERIAVSLGLELKEEDTSVRADRLSKRLENEKNILLVLDDIWDELNFGEVGIRFGDQHKGCKILLTSRNRDVLRNKMDAEKIFPINDLEEEEAWDLFKKMAGNDFENSDLLPVAIEVAKKCAGLPLAIVTVARALKKKPLPAWREALRQLQRPSPVNNIPAPVYSAIRLSYDNLEYEDLKRTFLLCCLLVHNSRIEELLRFAMGLHLFEGVNGVEETRNKVLDMVSNLKDSCLLLDDYKNDSIAMHDFIRDVAIVIARDNHVFVLRDGDVFEEWPEEEKMQNFKMICLSFATIKKKLPHELECPLLTLFSMGTSEWYSYLKMPPGFFEKMKNIKVLNLIQADFLSSASASAISFPTSLRTLCLKRCRLGDIVSLGKLKNLEILSLSESNIERLPEETRQLTKLRSLDLSGCEELKIIPPGVLSSLSRLEELLMGGGVIVGWNQEGNARLYELKELLSRLTTLEICILDAEIVKENLLFEKLQRYKIVIGVRWESYYQFENPRTIILGVNTSVDHLDDGIKGLLKKTQALYLTNLKGVEIVLNQVSNWDCFLHLSHLEIGDALEIRYIVNDNDAVDKIVFRQLRSLTLEKLPSLVSFCSKNRCGDSTSVCGHELPLFGEEMELPFLEDLYLSNINAVGRIWHNEFLTLKSLVKLEIHDCDNLKGIFSSSTAKSLTQLKSFVIIGCKRLREIIFSEDIEEEDDEVAISFPQLTTLTLRSLKHFIGFCSESYKIIFPSLKTLKISDSPELKEFIYKSTREDNTLLYVQALFDEKVAFPILEELKLENLESCQTIWHDQFDDDSFFKLNDLSIRNCGGLLNVFPFNMSERLRNLIKFEVSRCNLLEEIFAPQILDADELHAATPSIAEERATSFVFPKLISLSFDGLPKLKSFYSKMHTTKWPSLKRMHLGEGYMHRGRNYMVEVIFASGSLSLGELANQPLFWVTEETFPTLEELRLKQIQRKSWHGQFLANVFSKLRVLELEGFSDTSTDFPNIFIQSLPNLEKLVVSNAAISQIDELALTSLNALSLAKLPQLTHLWKEECNLSRAFCKLRSLEVKGCGKLKNLLPSSVSFENLTTLEISNCHGIVNLIACSTAKGLVQLTEMSISDCEMIEEIIAGEGNEVKGDIVFARLKYLKLSSLPSLVSFCLGKHNFGFLALEKVSVIGCPNMKIFSQGDLSTPILQRVQYIEDEDEDEGCWEGSLNATIKWLFEEKIRLRGIEQLSLSDSSKWIEIWRNLKGILCFKSLKYLEVHDCNTLRCIFTVSIALDLPQLSWLRVSNCTMMEHIILNEGPDDEVENKIVFPRLETINLEDCADLASFYQGSKILKCPSLKTLYVIDCPKMFAFASMLSRETIDDGENTSSRLSSDAAFLADKMELPFLEDLNLFKINAVGRIWHNQFLTLKSLATLEIENCDNLKDILSSSTAKSLAQLKSFHISDCKRLREIIFSEDIEEDDKAAISFPQLTTLRLHCLEHFIGFCSENYNIIFPSLKRLEIWSCPELNKFIYKSTREDNTFLSVQALFDEKVAFPQLEELILVDLKSCQKIWHDQHVSDSFSKLNELSVQHCERLLNVFPFNTSERLRNLIKFEVEGCALLEEIFASQILDADQLHAATPSIAEETTTSFVFPKLTSLVFDWLPKLKSFYSEMHTTKWPSLKRMHLGGCDMVEIIFASESLSFGELTNQQPLFWVNEDTFPKLEELKLKRIRRMAWHGQFRANVFSKLRVFELEGFSDTSTDFPNIFIQSLPNLEKLVVRDAAFSQIDELALTSLNELSLAKLPQLTHLWKGECNLGRAFYNLRSLEVQDCGKLKNLLPSSVSFENLTTLEISKCHGIVNLIACVTAKSLVQLTQMSITDCEMIEEIIAGEGDEVKGDIIFARLKHLKLSYLPSLASFCSGKHNFDFPALEKVSVIGCPNMKIFSQGDLITPILQRVQYIEYEDEGRWKGNLNATIEWLFEEKVGLCEIKELSLSNSSIWIEIWKNFEGILRFRSLASLQIHDCKTLRCLFTVSLALDLPQLSRLKVSNCTMMEHVILDEGSDEEVENKIVFPRLETISVERCADLASFYQGSKILKCPSLKMLDVIDCPKMFAFASTFSRETIDDGGNTSSRLSSDAAFLDDKVEFPQLETLSIDCVGNCKRIWHDHLIDDSFSNLTNLSVWNCDKLQNVFSLNMSHRLQKLMEFEVEKCDSLEQIFEPQIFNPDLHTTAATESIVFASLEYLHLSYLPSLASFCSGTHNFEFPTLKKTFVRECPKMKIFCEGDLSAPKLQKVMLTEDEDEDEDVWRWEGNLKVTVQRLFEEMNVQNAEDDEEDVDNKI